ncbi:ABC transporter permease [Shimia thalassica]|uniref:Glutathione transport system permease protein GsiC n=1 Tax=Shimia thalassica TaxID=1715693 RepID=A0A0P1IEY1_9RHOB|nr:ABC transporter permease [Shimia thalassica]PHO05537.1 ABC transporter permease [Rhodobacteraceae bacterium 4F10]MBU2944991.1 ABC transporter permease [Shimia thalassica]MDO6481194.1 ABC transporter permease [Shimia thalassica]MDO6484897.1 ABC transporter permease [Shimia thalassica]MDO6504701.1 ABC transporter permease [Shimia thalassica]
MASILRIIAQRLALGIVTLFVVSIVIFAAVNLLPGDFAQLILGQGATPEAVEAIRQDLGLDQPPITRYFQWLAGAVQGDLGNSFAQANFASFAGTDVGTGQGSVAAQIAPRFENTMFLAGVTAVIAVPISITLGVLAALYRNSAFDRTANILTLSSISSPEFFLAYILILFLAVLNPILPSLSNIYDGMELSDRFIKTLLPALTLTLVVTAHMMRMTRAAIINLLASPYIEMARLKGISPMRVIVKHALPNALAPIINVIALNLAYLITGVVVVEVVFVYPGIGQLFVDSVKIRDIPVVQACCLIFAAAYILLNLTADILSIISNPRLRHPK